MEPDDEFTEKQAGEAGTELVVEIVMDLHTSLFRELEQESPEQAEALKEDYGRYMKFYSELTKEQAANRGHFDDLNEFPENKWLAFFHERMIAPLLQNPPAETEAAATQSEEDHAEWRRKIKERLRGKDIH